MQHAFEAVVATIVVFAGIGEPAVDCSDGDGGDGGGDGGRSGGCAGVRYGGCRVLPRFVRYGGCRVLPRFYFFALEAVFRHAVVVGIIQAGSVLAPAGVFPLAHFVVRAAAALVSVCEAACFVVVPHRREAFKALVAVAVRHALWRGNLCDAFKANGRTIAGSCHARRVLQVGFPAAARALAFAVVARGASRAVIEDVAFLQYFMATSWNGARQHTC